MYKKFSQLFYFLLFITPSVFSNQVPEERSYPQLEPIEYNQNTEGFLAGTLIKTPHGYTSIELLLSDDIISGLNENQKIIQASRTSISHYYKINTSHATICAAPNQQFYMLDGTIKNASKLIPNDILENHDHIFSIEKTYNPSTCYYISTEQHSFIVYPNIHVHNFNFLTLGTYGFSISLGIVECCNPIIVATGGVLLLSFFATEFFKQYIAHNLEFDDKNTVLTNENLALQNYHTVHATREYYSLKRKELLELHQTLLLLKNGIISSIRYTIYYQSPLLQEYIASIYNSVYIDMLLPDLTYEISLSMTQKQQLIISRDSDLEKIENEILDLAFAIALYINQLIEQRQEMSIIEEKTNLQVAQEADIWNYNRPNMSIEIGVTQYIIDLIWDLALKNLEDRCLENRYVFTYLQKLINNVFLTKISNVQGLCVAELKLCQKHLETIKTSRTIWLKNIQISEKYLKKEGILTQDFINQVQGRINQQQLTHKNNWLQYNKKKKTDIKKAIDPKNNKQTPDPEKDPDEEPSCIIGYFLNAIPHIFRDKRGHLLNTETNRKLLLEMARKKRNFLGADARGNHWYAEMLPDGKQLWAWARNNLIRDGGLNETPRPFNCQTGLCRNIPGK